MGRATHLPLAAGVGVVQVGLDTHLRLVLGSSATPLGKQRSIRSVGEFLDFLPTKYVDPERPSDFSTITDGEDVVLVATVLHAKTRPMKRRKGSMLVATVVDEHGNQIDLTFFRVFGHEQALLPGVVVVCSGTVSSFGDRRQLTHPEYQVLPNHQESGPTSVLGSGLIPVYPAVKGLTPIKMHAAMDLVLQALPTVPDPVPEHIRSARGLPTALAAYRGVHQPGTIADVKRARWRMKYAEAFVIQAALAGRRRASDAVPAVARPGAGGGLSEGFLNRLPFDLTDGQQQVRAEIGADLARDTPMHRLLQGEVGSGKTILALLGMLTVIDSGGQAVLLAPTEVLAAQHYRSVTDMLGPYAQAGMLGGEQSATRVALLTGSQTARERQRTMLMAASGEAGIVIGTHALIQEHVTFAELAMVVVDEQHRFGVQQRDALRTKAADGVAPHVLVMTATPIPRTVAMTVFGDMEVSTLRELPHGRLPITTHVVTGDKSGWVQRTWVRVAEEAAAGHQVYVVCPRIGADDDADLGQGEAWKADAYPGPGVEIETADGTHDDGTGDAAIQRGGPLHGVLQVHRALLALAATADLRIGLLHGRMAVDAKDEAMAAFNDGTLDVLVATTVIEVGVDVSAATVMVVVDADRFGISQLHQLRGRVGRGTDPGLCLLLTQHTDTPALERLDAVASTTDGFELARVDLESRREGDVLGAVQSGGRSGLRFLRLTRDEDLIVQAHDDAWAVVSADPDLTDNRALRQTIAALDDERAAYLERG
ncbi:MAG: ATP-dependent DNA helicase RecG [Ornithinimicrobium sp.]